MEKWAPMRKHMAYMGLLQSLCSGTSQSSWRLSYAFTINPLDTCSLWPWWSLFLQARVCLYCKWKAPERIVIVQEVISCYLMFRGLHDYGSHYELCKQVLPFLLFPPLLLQWSLLCLMLLMPCPYALVASEVICRWFPFIRMLRLWEGVLWTEECLPQWVKWSEYCRVYTPEETLNPWRTEVGGKIAQVPFA